MRWSQRRAACRRPYWSKTDSPIQIPVDAVVKVMTFTSRSKSKSLQETTRIGKPTDFGACGSRGGRANHYYKYANHKAEPLRVDRHDLSLERVNS